MVATDSCPICRKPVLSNDPTIVAARVRGMAKTIVSYFHESCYPGDEGTVFERIDKDKTGRD